MGSAAHPITDCSQIKPRAGVEAAPVGTLDPATHMHPRTPPLAAAGTCPKECDGTSQDASKFALIRFADAAARLRTALGLSLVIVYTLARCVASTRRATYGASPSHR